MLDLQAKEGYYVLQVFMRALSKEKAADGIGGMVRHAIITDRKLYIFADEDIDSMCALDKEILINAIYGLL